MTSSSAEKKKNLNRKRLKQAVEARKVEEESVDQSEAERNEEEIAPALAGSVEDQELDFG